MLEQQIAAPQIRLRDGREVLIRPLCEEDREPLLAFGVSLPQHELLYLEDDFRSADIISRLINARFAENWRQVVAEANGKIVGYSAARRLPGWSSHVAEIMLVVGTQWRRAGLGSALAQAIFDAARQLNATKVVVEVLEEQSAGQEIFRQLGFKVEGRMIGHARDRRGQPHNLMILAYHVCYPTR